MTVLPRVAGELSPAKRILLAIYGLAAAFIFVWVPWHGRKQELVDARAHKPDPVRVGYGLVWSSPKQPAAFVNYAAENANYNDYRPGVLLPKPKVPEGYLPSYAYESATIDYGRVGLEFGELTVILLVVWKFTAPRTNTKRDA